MKAWGKLPNASCHVVGEDYGIVAGARDGNVGKSRVEQVWVNAGVGVNEDPLSGKTLRAVAGNCIAVVEVRMFAGIKFNPAIIGQARGDAAIGMDRFDDGEVAIRNAERFVGCGELDSHACGETLLIPTELHPVPFSKILRTVF